MTSTNPATASTTLEAADAPPSAAFTRITVVFRWEGGRELSDLDSAGALLVGRGETCDLRIKDRSLSRQHARFTRAGDELTVEDLGSRNGVLLHGTRVKSAQLHSGDLVGLGHVSATVHIFAAQGSASLKPPSIPEIDTSWSDVRMAELRRTIDKITDTPLPVLVLGETGSGKELVAVRLHRASARAKAPLRIVNCAAIPATLIETTLFGHERGAFTGADRSHAGAFEQAQCGTLFLDEIGELSLPAQAALLRVLETGRFCRVGGAREIEVDVRIVAATHRDLEAMVHGGDFRLDLLHRLDSICLRVPPLRERVDALEPLIDHFLTRAALTWAKGRKRMDAAAMALLRAYSWPGNVRELRNTIDRAVAISDSDVMGIADLPERVQSFNATAPGCVSTETAPAAGAALKDKHAREERGLLASTLQATGGNQQEAARQLGWSLRTLQRRAQQYGLARMTRS